MKKLFFLGALFAVGLGFTACSSDKDAVVNDASGQQIADNKGYVSLAISLPTNTANTTRANDVFDDGLTGEYTVNNTTLLFFNGDETTSTLVESYTPSIAAWNKHGTSTDQITTVAKLVQSVSSQANDLYLLVVLNAVNLPTLTTGTTTVEDVLNATVSNPAAITAGTMLMTNAPLAVVPGGATNPSSSNVVKLVKIAKENIYSTETEARSNPAAEVYVERIAVKVTVNSNSGTTENGALAYSLDGWALDNYNTSASMVRSTDGFASTPGFYNYYSDLVTTNKYRMIGGTAVGTNGKTGEDLKTYYRIYWAKDANYDQDAGATVGATTYPALTTTTSPTFKTVYGGENPAYCFENTFDVGHQLYKNTTRVIMRLKFNDGEGFYTLGGDASKIYLIDTSVKTGTKISDKLKEFLMNLTDVKTWLTDNTKSGETFGESDITSITIAPKTGSTSEYEVTAIEFSTTKLNSAPTSANYSDWVTALNNAVDGITFYTGGYSYYTVLIKHFGDDLTPWTAGTHMSGGAYDDEGTAPISRYLGRYGVLRNNWYDLNINKVQQIGSATVPSVTGDGTTDDVVKSYISVKINVLSWAKRTQNVDL